MKKIVCYAASFLLVAAVAAAPGTKLLEQFKTTFPNAQNVKWSENKDGYAVSFYQNNDFAKVLYNNQGDFVCSWKYSSGKDLPTSVAIKMNKKYAGAEIIGVTELTTENDTVYEVKASRGSKLYTIHFSADGSIMNVTKFDNQDATGAKG